MLAAVSWFRVFGFEGLPRKGFGDCELPGLKGVEG